MTPAEIRAERDRIATVALHLFGLGLSVFPVHHPWTPIPDWCNNPEKWTAGKSAMVRWKDLQTERASERQVRSWFQGGFLYNVGLTTGAASGFDVVDVDSADGIAWAEENLEPTPMVTLSGREVDGGFRGEHRYYRRPEGVDGWLRRKVPVEIKTTRQCITAPGSRHPSGRLYEATVPWTSELLAAVPFYAGSKLYEPLPPAAPRREGVFLPDPEHMVVARCQAYVDKIEGCASGGRHNEAVHVALLIGNDYDLPGDSGLEILRDWNSRNDPPLPERELEDIFRTAPASALKPRGCKRDQPPPLRFPSQRANPSDAPPHSDDDFQPPAGSAVALPLADVVPHPAARISLASQMDETETEFVLLPYLPKGEIALLSAPGGRGKSTAAVKIGAAVTVCGAICGLRPKGGKVLYYGGGEDDPRAIIRRRFRHAGADLDEVGIYRSDLDKGTFVLDRSGVAKMRAELAAYRPALVVIDPLVNFMPGGFDMNNNVAMTKLLSPIADMGKDFECCFLVIVHHNAKDDIAGCKALWNRSKSVMTVYDHPLDPELKVIAHRKTNFRRAGKCLTFRIQEAVPGDEASAAAVWGGLSSDTIEQLQALTQMSSVERHLMREAVAGVEGALRGGRHLTFYDLVEACAGGGVERRHVTAARIYLRCKTDRYDGNLYLRLPDDHRGPEG